MPVQSIIDQPRQFMPRAGPFDAGHGEQCGREDLNLHGFYPTGT